jgi:hypothetical protein
VGTVAGKRGQTGGSASTEHGPAIVRASTSVDRLAKIERMQARLRSALSEWADDDLLIARLHELEREAERLRERLGIERVEPLVLGSR